VFALSVKSLAGIANARRQNGLTASSSRPTRRLDSAVAAILFASVVHQRVSFRHSTSRILTSNRHLLGRP